MMSSRLPNILRRPASVAVLIAFAYMSFTGILLTGCGSEEDPQDNAVPFNSDNQSANNQNQEQNANQSDACEGSLSSCGGECVDNMQDPAHCGQCGVACTGDETCEAGSCVAVCSEPEELCSDICVDTESDVFNCGVCDETCFWGESCSEGQCVVFAEHVVAGWFVSCAMTSDGKLPCWGSTDMEFFLTLQENMKEVENTYASVCGILDDDTLHCEGATEESELEQVPSGDFIDIGVAYEYACAVRDLGDIVCWGIDTGEHDILTSPTGSFIAVSSSSFHSCAITEGDQTVECWGNNTYGQLDAPAGGFRQIAVGVAFSCGLRLDDTVECWGDGQNEGIGEPPAGTFEMISAGAHFACGLRADQTIECWGSDDNGETTPPTGTFKHLNSGYGHACAVRDNDDTVECWGDNISGQSDVPG